MRLGLALALLAVFPGPAPTQTNLEPNQTFFSIFGGFVVGGDLWTLSRQRAAVIDERGREVSVDTFALARTTSAGLTVGVHGIYYPVPPLGLDLELSYTAPAVDDGCRLVFDSRVGRANPNREFCANIDASGGVASAVNLTLGVVVRPLPRAATRPYIRLSAGIADQSSTTVEISGSYRPLLFFQDQVASVQPRDRLLIEGDESADIRPSASLAVGFTIPAAMGYHLRWELRDQMYRRDVVAGPADELAVAPVRSEWRHNISLMVGVDFVLRRSSSRR